MPPEADARPGEVIGPVELGSVAHGGHVVARYEGRVVFVRHGLPGERVLLRLTDTSRASFWRADVAEVLEATKDRVVPPCTVAATCGGCDFQHVSHDGQRRLKSAVLREQLTRLAGLDLAVEVEQVPLPGRDARLHWRTRVQYHVDHGHVGLRAHRSHDVVDLPDHGCLIAAPGPTPDQIRAWAQGAVTSVEVVVADPATVLVDGQVVVGAPVVAHEVLGRRLEVRADGFWQVHPRAAEVLTQTVIELLTPREGERALDLYCGVGLFASALDQHGVEVVGVESSTAAARLARSNVLAARVIAGPLERSLRRLPRQVDLVVLDPPRAGAGERVISHVTGLGARSIVQVGCDPASFARDLASFARHGYEVRRVRAFDLFPMTHHFESVALLEPTAV